MEISNTYIFWGVIKIGEERRRQNDFKKKTFAGQNRQKYLSFTSMCVDFANSQKKKQFKIPLPNVRLLGGTP